MRMRIHALSRTITSRMAIQTARMFRTTVWQRNCRLCAVCQLGSKASEKPPRLQGMVPKKLTPACAAFIAVLL
jgi:hypothetical protein